MHVLCRGMKWRKGHPNSAWRGCLPGALTKHGLFLLTVPSPLGYPPKQLVRLTPQDGKTTLQFLRVQLMSSLVCTHVHTCPARCQHRRFHSVPPPPLRFTATSLVRVRIFPAWTTIRDSWLATVRTSWFWAAFHSWLLVFRSQPTNYDCSLVLKSPSVLLFISLLPLESLPLFGFYILFAEWMNLHPIRSRSFITIVSATLWSFAL